VNDYLIRRLLQVPATLFIVATALFVFFQLAGDPVVAILPIGATEEMHQKLREEMGLNDPILEQYARSMWNLLHGDFGESHLYRQPAANLILERLPASTNLALAALLVGNVAGVLVGASVAWNDQHRVSHFMTRIVFMLESIPGFWLAVLLIYWLAVRFHLLPTSGYGGIQFFVLPTLTLAILLFPRMYLLTRAAILDVKSQPYVITARAKGNVERRVLWRHAFRNALVVLMPYFGLQPARLLGSAVVIELIFAWPGIGRLALEGVDNRDISLVYATGLTLAFISILSSLVVDIANTLIDPRIRLSQHE
jgi:peptide/nickel transport system permease protein